MLDLIEIYFVLVVFARSVKSHRGVKSLYTAETATFLSETSGKFVQIFQNVVK